MDESARRLHDNLDFTYQTDEGEVGYARDLESAQQECQAVAQGPLHWGTDGRTWIAKDLETGELYKIEKLPF